MTRRDYDAITNAMARAKPRPALANPKDVRREYDKLLAWLDTRDMLANALAANPKFKKDKFLDDCR